MKATVKLFTTDGDTTRGFPIKLIVSHKGKTKRKTIGFSSINHWDDLHQLPNVAHPDFENLYGKILDLRKMAITSAFLESESVETALYTLLGEQNKKNVLVKDYFTKEIGYLEASKRYGTATLYTRVKKQVDLFAPGLTFDKITPSFLEEFKRYKMKSCNNITLQSYISVFRALYNKAVFDSSVLVEDTNPFKKVMRSIPVKRGRDRLRYLDRDGIAQLENLVEMKEGISEMERRAVVFALLQFYFGGSGFKEIYYLKRSQFFKDRVMLRRFKLSRKGFDYDVKVFPKAKKLLKMYEGNDKVYFFDFPKDEDKYIGLRNYYTMLLKKLQEKHEIKVHPINKNFTPYVMRYTFATLAKFEFIDTDIIRELMGHERQDIDVWYKDMFPEAVRDAAHAKIIGM